jgi:hypothetical protein
MDASNEEDLPWQTDRSEQRSAVLGTVVVGAAARMDEWARG